MELCSLSENIVTRTYERSGETCVLKINIDAITPDYTEAIEDRLEPVAKRMEVLGQQHMELVSEIEELQKKEAADKEAGREIEPIDFKVYSIRLRDIKAGIADVKREMYAGRLTCPVSLPDGSTTCILKGWDTTLNGEPLPPSKENLMRMTSAAIESLFEFVMAQAETVKKRVDEETEGILAYTPNGSKAPSLEATHAPIG